MKQITLTEKRFFEWHVDDVSVTIRHCGGSYGGGSEVFVICYDEDDPEFQGITEGDDGICPTRE